MASSGLGASPYISLYKSNFPNKTLLNDRCDIINFPQTPHYSVCKIHLITNFVVNKNSISLPQTPQATKSKLIIMAQSSKPPECEKVLDAHTRSIKLYEPFFL